MPNPKLTLFLPILFAALWSTGFSSAKLGLPYIQPYSLLAIRFVLTLILLGGIVLLLKPPMPQTRRGYIDVFISGLLIHAAYLGGVFTAIKLGLPSGITAVVVGLQPVLTTLITQRFQSAAAIITSVLGFVGLLLVVSGGKFDAAELDAQLYLPALISLLGITLGTLYQKKHCADFHVLTITFLQYLPTVLVFSILAFSLEHEPIVWHSNLIISITWLVLVLSIGAIMLMSYLYQHNSASLVANYFYLAPPLALIQGYFMFDESIGAVNLLGMILIVAAIYLSPKLAGRQGKKNT